MNNQELAKILIEKCESSTNNEYKIPFLDETTGTYNQIVIKLSGVGFNKGMGRKFGMSSLLAEEYLNNNDLKW